ncbi:MAG: peptidylprolyl isomerase [Cellulosilyticaceae bacterium]
MSSMPYALKINQKYVTHKEVGFVKKHLRGRVIAEVQGKYGLSYNTCFWDQPIDEGTPRQLLWDRLCETLIKHSICEELLKRYGLLNYDGFEAFEMMWRTTNQQRQNAVKKGEVIYGPIQYSRWDYFCYLMSNGMIHFKQRWFEACNSEISSDALQNFADSQPNLLGKEPTLYKVWRIYIPYVTLEGVIDQTQQRRSNQILKEVHQLLIEGHSLDPVLIARGVVLQREEIFGGSKQRTDLMTHRPVLEALGHMQVGTYSDVIESNGAYQIVLLLEKQEGKPRGFETNREYILSKYVDYQVEKLIAKYSHCAHVEVFEPISQILGSL